MEAAPASAMKKPVIVVHGGAGYWPSKRQRAGLAGVRSAAKVGWQALEAGGHAKDAVESAVVALEDNPVFNAGVGSALNLAGEVETDAGIMYGEELEGAGVALVRGVRNPIKLARLVLERTDHVLIAGEGAIKLARAFGLPRAKLAVGARLERWRWEKRAFTNGRPGLLRKNLRLFRGGYLANTLDTVGAVALDSHGDLCAGCSTGGLSLKIPGRIGDSAILGAGLYADNTLGAAIATGIGELAVRLGISKTVCDAMREMPAEKAAGQSIKLAGKKVGRGLGIIAVDRNGGIGVAHNTTHLCWAGKVRDDEVVAKIRGTRF